MKSVQELKLCFPKGGPQHDFMEIFCPPRMVPIAVEKGLHACMSIDILTGWNIGDPRVQKYIINMVHTCKPKMVHMSCPCCPFSQLQRCNVGRTDPEKVRVRLEEGRDFLALSMKIAKIQHKARPRRYFRILIC